MTAAVRPVAVVMPTWNALAYTRACVAALRSRTEHPAWRLVVVDNGSTDGTVEWLRTVDGVAVIANPRNLGFSKACNMGIAAASGDEDVVLINNDVEILDPRWLTSMQEAAYGSPHVGVVGCRLVDGEGLISHLGSFMPPIALFGQQMGGQELDINQARRDRTVESVVFAQVYLARACIDRTGVLDEEFFSYFEDADYCVRAQRAGFRVLFAGEVTSVHHGNVSTRENRVDFWSMFNRSQRVFERKWADWLENGRYDTQVVWHSILHRAPGYALQSRKLMLALNFEGVRVMYRNAYGEDDGRIEHPLLDDIRARKPRLDVPQVAFCQADVFRGVKGRRRVGWTMLEVDGLPEAWVAGCNSMDEVWVPASFNVETFRESGVRAPIHVMPLGVDVDYFHPGITGFRPSDRFTFLSVFEWGERKGAELLLRAFADEFKESEDVLLLLSIYNRDPDVDVHGEIVKLGLGPCPPIIVMVNAEFVDYQMGSLYRSADCFVLPTRGEGWGMPVLEAMASGLPTIATAWSGPADFLNAETGYPLEVRSLVPAKAKCPYYDGFRWADPDVEHLRFLMRHVVDRPDEARSKGAAAASFVAANLTWEHAARRVKDRLRLLDSSP
ncbi:MAG: glycosyltransferase [Actinomycetota bacterium]|nr:glycosyltransferase [Actinomycetota bacterium]